MKKPILINTKCLFSLFNSQLVFGIAFHVRESIFISISTINLFINNFLLLFINLNLFINIGFFYFSFNIIKFFLSVLNSLLVLNLYKSLTLFINKDFLLLCFIKIILGFNQVKFSLLLVILIF